MKDRVRRMREVWEENKWIFIAIFLLDFSYFLFMWMLDDQRTQTLSAVVILLTAVLYFFLCFWLAEKKRRREEYLQEFLEGEDFSVNTVDVSAVSAQERYVIETLQGKILSLEKERRDLSHQQEELKEYVETWVHEIKTPLSLVTLMLDNREEEMSGEVYQRMQYINTRMQEYVDQILYFSRLNCQHKDYIFESVDLQECVQEILSEYRYFFAEKHIETRVIVGGTQVFTDRKGLEFILRQAVSNSIKYMSSDNKEKVLKIYAENTDREIDLSIEDNGIGVSESDLPFVFEKGFSGENGMGNKKSTGMGLYLVREMAKSMNLRCEAANVETGGFRLVLIFPIV